MSGTPRGLPRRPPNCPVLQNSLNDRDRAATTVAVRRSCLRSCYKSLPQLSKFEDSNGQVRWSAPTAFQFGGGGGGFDFGAAVSKVILALETQGASCTSSLSHHRAHTPPDPSLTPRPPPPSATEAVDFFAGLSMNLSANVQAAVGEARCIALPVRSARRCSNRHTCSPPQHRRYSAPAATPGPTCRSARKASLPASLPPHPALCLNFPLCPPSVSAQVGRHAEGTVRLDLHKGIMFNSAYNYNQSSGVFAGAGLQARPPHPSPPPPHPSLPFPFLLHSFIPPPPSRPATSAAPAPALLPLKTNVTPRCRLRPLLLFRA